MKPSQVILTATERVTVDQPAAQAIVEEATSRQCKSVFILVGSSLRRQTDEIARIEQALGNRHAATWDGVGPHAPRQDVLAAAAAARAAGADMIVTVGGGSVTDTGKIVAPTNHQRPCRRHVAPSHPSCCLREGVAQKVMRPLGVSRPEE